MVENSLEMTDYSRLCKKIAGVLEKQSAYKFLYSFSNVEIKDNKLRLVLTRENQLTSFETEIVIKQVHAVYGSGYEIAMYNCNFNRQGNKVSQARAKYQHKSSDNNSASDAQNKKLDIWEEIRKRFISSIGRDGQAIDNARLKAKYIAEGMSRVDTINRILAERGIVA